MYCLTVLDYPAHRYCSGSLHQLLQFIQESSVSSPSWLLTPTRMTLSSISLFSKKFRHKISFSYFLFMQTHSVRSGIILQKYLTLQQNHSVIHLSISLLPDKFLLLFPRSHQTVPAALLFHIHGIFCVSLPVHSRPVQLPDFPDAWNSKNDQSHILYHQIVT